jgi:hypothetical protein
MKKSEYMECVGEITTPTGLRCAVRVSRNNRVCKEIVLPDTPETRRLVADVRARWHESGYGYGCASIGTDHPSYLLAVDLMHASNAHDEGYGVYIATPDGESGIGYAAQSLGYQDRVLFGG